MTTTTTLVGSLKTPLLLMMMLVVVVYMPTSSQAQLQGGMFNMMNVASPASMMAANPLGFTSAMGRLGGRAGVGGGGGNTIYTAIGIDNLDNNSQMRVTIRERRRGNSGFMGGNDADMPRSWYVHGTFIGSELISKAGAYHVVLTETGRTRDGCDAASLGRVVGDVTSPFGQVSGDRLAGQMPDKLVMGTGSTTVYASRLLGVSRSQLAGAGVAVCQYITGDGLCGGDIPFCATVSKDNLPAMEVPRAGTSVPRTTIVRFDINKLGGGFEQAGLGGGLGLGGGFDSGLGGTDGLFGPGFGDSAGSNNIMTNDQGLN